MYRSDQGTLEASDENSSPLFDKLILFAKEREEKGNLNNYKGWIFPLCIWVVG